jgi:hypothetical protein
MWRLMKKFSPIFILYSVIAAGLVFPMMNHDRLTGPDPLTLNFVFTMAPFLFLIILGTIYIHEQFEQKTNGYAFLRILPIKFDDIVIAKFLLVFLTTLFYVGFHCVAFSRISNDPNYLGPSCSYLIINANICLLLAALLYLGIFRFGFSKVGKYLLVFWLVIILAPIPITSFLLKRWRISRLEIIEKVVSLNWVIVTLICVGLYFLLMRMAVKILEGAKR